MKPSRLRVTRDSTASAPLLYWLLVVSGLVGITIMRWEDVWETTPIWLGTVVGVGLGQVLAWQRIRAWIPAVIAICGLWFAPVLYFIMVDAFGDDAEVAALAFLPAAFSGYLSLSSERGVLVAFWYPAVLWMLVILDGPAAISFDMRSGAPFAVGLAALFVAFLRARETRRTVLFKRHASERLAQTVGPSLLRSSPARSVAQLAYTALVGVGALVLAAWIAPHLFKLEKEKHARAVAARAAAQVESYSMSSSPSGSASDEQPCCWEQSLVEEKKVRVKEYLPLLRGHREHRRIGSRAPCKMCGSRTASYASHGPGFGGSSSSSSVVSSGAGPSRYTSTNEAAPPAPADVAPSTPKTEDAPKPDSTKPTPTDTAGSTEGSPGAPPFAPGATSVPGTTPTDPVVTLPPATSAPPRDIGAPWQWTLGLSIAALGLHLLLRAFRRAVTLRHLAHPFWQETTDQRISNHWERMLIGLGDAGIHPARNEQPQAFARRVGIEGMTTCATILERVRHGVRVDEGDLESMAGAATRVYREARARAGLLGRLTGFVRSPLA